MGTHKMGETKRYLLAFLLTLSLLGLFVSLTTHLATLFGINPQDHIPRLWVLQLVLVALLLPIVVELFSTRNPWQILRSPVWLRRSLYVLLVYYGANFYVFLYWSANHLSSHVTWRMFTSGWLLLFALTSLYYWVRLEESKGGFIEPPTGPSSSGLPGEPAETTPARAARRVRW